MQSSTKPSEIYICEKSLAKRLGIDEVKVDGCSENLLTYLKLKYSDDVLEQEETIKLLENTMILNQSDKQKYFNSIEFVQSVYPHCLIARASIEDQEYILMKVNSEYSLSLLIPIDAELFLSKELADKNFELLKKEN